ncbi:glycosyltransferase family 2 protein [Hippea maritima]|uniref:Glycosyl transferase family 2 n=1 Tax=Hippea maritima (strain ATCC 700847 / DSM 10411 / MH2) TaxID=760142 RepID=F2LWT5_HIPMA|nr:glycosyltransferase family 2 protein [Hippea maritima]AEA33063.1 glycosyl transferase family 2 [Hippea maritima DSM 10411]
MSLGCAIITYNEEKSLERTLRSVAFCDEIVVVDSGSTDRTTEIARHYTDKVYYQEWLGYGKQKNFAISKLSTDWVLSIDADEVLSENLKDEIIEKLKNPAVDAYALNIQLVFMGKPLRFGGTYPDYHVRLFRRGKCFFDEAEVHEGVNCKAERLKNVVYHYSYENLEDYFDKFNRYTSLLANNIKQKKPHISGVYPFVRFSLEIAKRFVLKGAFLDGYEGCVYALLSSFYAFVKYAKAKELAS